MSPTTATAIAAVVGVLGTLLGISVRGMFDARMLDRQITEQRKSAERQFAEQRSLLDRQFDEQRAQLDRQFDERRIEQAVDRAEARAQALLQLRRELYATVLAVLEELQSDAMMWHYYREELEKRHPNVDWANTPSDVADPFGLIEDPIGASGSVGKTV